MLSPTQNMLLPSLPITMIWAPSTQQDPFRCSSLWKSSLSISLTDCTQIIKPVWPLLSISRATTLSQAISNPCLDYSNSLLLLSCLLQFPSYSPFCKRLNALSKRVNWIVTFLLKTLQWHLTGLRKKSLKTPNLDSQSLTPFSSLLSITASHATSSPVCHIPATLAFLLLELEAPSSLKAFVPDVPSSGKALPLQHKDGSFLPFIFYLKPRLFRITSTDLHTGYHSICDISPICLFTYFLLPPLFQ